MCVFSTHGNDEAEQHIPLIDLLSPELSWACSHLAAPPEQLWSPSSPCAGVVREGLGKGQEKEGELSWCQDLTWRGGTVRLHTAATTPDHSPSCKAEMSSCEEGVLPGNAAMLPQIPQHIQVPPFMSFIVPNSRSKVLGRHVPLLLLLPPPLLLHRAAAGKKRKKSRFRENLKSMA